MYKIGIGKDSHRFLKIKTNKPLMIGGVKIEGLPAFEAHSDGDVLYHSLFNAITSAIGKKSIGFYFPNTSSRDENQNSHIFLEKAKSFLVEDSYKINNISIAVECSQPNINKIEDKIKNNLSQIFNIKESQIGITATTGEGVTPWGSGEGVEITSIISVKRTKYNA